MPSPALATAVWEVQMARPGELLPEDFLAHLTKTVDRFAGLPGRHQWALAGMLWQGSVKRRQHRTIPGAMSFSQRELDERFGLRQFAKVMRAIDFFTRSADWSHARKTTRGYWFSQQVRIAQAAYFAEPTVGITRVLSLTGAKLKVAKSLPSAISSIDTNGNPVSAASAAAWETARHMNRVPINTAKLEGLRDELAKILNGGAELDAYVRAMAERLNDITLKILRMATTDLAGPGFLLQVYSMAPSGRLYARGLNLQSAPSLIKQAALHGLWEYDFSNCHFSIASQMARRYGAPCAAIEHYMANKVKVREEVAARVGIAADQVKRCFLALLYGARPSGRAVDAIPAAIGLDAAKQLYEQPEFKALQKDILGARRTVLAAWPRTPNGSLKNDSDKALRGSTASAALLAHLLQGSEARALREVVMRHHDDIVLLQHDGFTARRRLDCRDLEDRVFAALGYRLGLEERQLQLPIGVVTEDRIKSEVALEAAPGLDFSAALYH